jgi:hypothetical protein
MRERSGAASLFELFAIARVHKKEPRLHEKSAGLILANHGREARSGYFAKPTTQHL